MPYEFEEENKELKKLLDSIDFGKIREDLSEGEKMRRADDAETFWKNWFESKLLSFIQSQLIKMVIGNEDTVFDKGGVKAFFAIKDWFDHQIKLSRSKFDKPEEEPQLGEV